MPLKVTALFGAGLTKNFGGFLSRDIWGQILCHPRVRNKKSIRMGLIEHENHERVLGDVRQRVASGDLQQQALDDLEDAIREVFSAMEERITSALQTTRTYDIQDFMRQFDTQAFGGGSYMFTLNQDLMVEQLFLGVHKPGGRVINRPGVQIRVGGSTDEWGYRFSHAKMEKGKIQTILDPTHIRNKGFSYVKLHGSIEWMDAAGRMMIMGTDKDEQRHNFPLLTTYGDLFESVLMETSRLLVMGYSFGDWHINRAIHQAVKNGTRVLIWDTCPLEKSRDQWGYVEKDMYAPEPRADFVLPGFLDDMLDSLVGYVTLPFNEAVTGIGEFAPGLKWFFKPGGRWN